MFLPHPRVKVSIVGSLRDREVACSASDRQGSNFESCVWRTVSSQSSHHPQEILLAQFSLYVHKGGLKPDSFLYSESKLLKLSVNLTLKALNFLKKIMKTKDFFLFEIIINVFVSSSRFIWILMLWVYGHKKYYYFYSAGIDFSRQNLTSTDVRFRRLKSIPAL